MFMFNCMYLLIMINLTPNTININEYVKVETKKMVFLWIRVCQILQHHFLAFRSACLINSTGSSVRITNSYALHPIQPRQKFAWFKAPSR